MFQLEELSKLRLRGVAKSGAILSDDLAVENVTSETQLCGT